MKCYTNMSFLSNKEKDLTKRLQRKFGSYYRHRSEVADVSRGVDIDKILSNFEKIYN